MHNQKCAGANKSTSLIFRKQVLEPDTDVFCWSSIETFILYGRGGTHPGVIHTQF